MPTTHSSQYRHPAINSERFHVLGPMTLSNEIYNDIDAFAVGGFLDLRGKVFSSVIDGMCRPVRNGAQPIKFFCSRRRCSNGCPVNGVIRIQQERVEPQGRKASKAVRTGKLKTGEEHSRS